MSCPQCKRSNVVEIELKIKERTVTMRSCSRCDTRWWHSEGEALHLPGVLELASGL